jgi:3-oxoacyl-[acyl-carrier-protein] synthase II
MSSRIVVVGLGATTCLGPDLDTTWQNLLASRGGLRRHAHLDDSRYLQNIAGLIDDPPGAPDEFEKPASRIDARFILLGVRAARMAWNDAGLQGFAGDRDRVAVVVGSGLGGLDFYHREQARAATRKNLATSPYLIPGLVINQTAGQIAQSLDLHGPSIAPANACASGGHALAIGAMLLRAGEADLALCGGAESAFSPEVVNGFVTMKAMLGRKSDDRSIADPVQASRPFSADRAGFIMSEGAGIVIIATEAAVKRYNLRPRAELVAAATNTDGYHMAMPHEGKVRRCLELVLERAEIRPQEVDYYNAHGTSTTVNDRVETLAIKTIWGDDASRLPISSIKGALGHALGAASAIEAAVCVRALEDNIVPPTLNLLQDHELGLDFVPEPRPIERLDTILSASFGFGGTNNALIFRRWTDAA